MQIHHFDPETGIYAGSSPAQPDPMEWARTRAAAIAEAASQAHADYAAALQGGAALDTARADLAQALADAEALGEAVQPSAWLVPAHATLVPLPDIEDGQQARWNGEDAWIIEATPEPEPEPEPEPPTPAALAAAIRAERDALIAASSWLVERHREELEIDGFTWTSLSAADYQALLVYRQALRDVPAQPGFPATVDWPVAPDIEGL